MAEIQVRPLAENDGWQFEVTVSEARSATTHRVGLSREAHQRLTAGACDAATCVRRSFEFLLEREPKESILRQFELPLIGHYFPEYERELRARLRPED